MPSTRSTSCRSLWTCCTLRCRCRLLMTRLRAWRIDSRHRSKTDTDLHLARPVPNTPLSPPRSGNRHLSAVPGIDRRNLVTTPIRPHTPQTQPPSEPFSYIDPLDKKVPLAVQAAVASS